MSDVSAPVLNADQWWVQVRGRAYGPYSIAQLASFVAEGRIRTGTPVSTSADGGWREARAVPGLMAPLRSDVANDVAAQAANVFVHAEIVSGSWNAFMAALESMGFVCDLAPGLWLVRTKFSAGIIRNTLSQTLERGDRFVVIDATRDRLAWFNLGPGVDVHISKVWNGPLRGEAR